VGSLVQLGPSKGCGRWAPTIPGIVSPLEMEVGSLRRSALLYVPTGYDTRDKTPLSLVVAFHGYVAVFVGSLFWLEGDGGARILRTAACEHIHRERERGGGVRLTPPPPHTHTPRAGTRMMQEMCSRVGVCPTPQRQRTLYWWHPTGMPTTHTRRTGQALGGVGMRGALLNRLECTAPPATRQQTRPCAIATRAVQPGRWSWFLPDVSISL
jgi:hypothetical protein